MRNRRPPGTRRPANRIAVFLVYGAAAPLVALLIVVAAGGIFGIDAADARAALLAYAALALSFHAGLAGGHSIRAAAGSLRLAVTIAIAVAGWAALLIPVGAGLLLLAALTAAQGAFDVWMADGARLPSWYASPRAGATMLTVIVLILTFVLTPA